MVSLVCEHGASGQPRMQLQAVAPEIPPEIQQPELPPPSEVQADRERRERERLRFLMPYANALTIELTAQILVAQGLDQDDA
ncbi:MAG TPA: hypothetical protein VNP04_14985 [Alphaproteobacteria bacterium]|nr:hypothetical protein [Alphaproteobacteria bacterium]